MSPRSRPDALAGIERLYQESGYGIGDPTTWDPIVSKNQADVSPQSNESSPLGEDQFYGGTETSSDHTEVQLLSKETHTTEEEDNNTSTTERPSAINKTKESPTMEEESTTRKPEMSMLAANMDGMKCAEQSEG